MDRLDAVLRNTLTCAGTFAEQGRVLRGYRELLDGLAQAQDLPGYGVQAKLDWRAAIEAYEERWFPEEWQPLPKRSAPIRVTC